MNVSICTYEINEKNLIGDDGRKYTAYGVDCFEVENGFKRLVNQIIDVSVSLSEMQKFIDTLNSSNLSSAHLYDAVNDFICLVN